jgi:hypothetical protein
MKNRTGASFGAQSQIGHIGEFVNCHIERATTDPGGAQRGVIASSGVGGSGTDTSQ